MISDIFRLLERYVHEIRLHERSGLNYASESFFKAKNELYEAITSLERQLAELREGIENGTLSDGYHSFNDLYHQRAYLFATICNQNSWRAWKSKKHSDGSMFGDDWFIVGIFTPKGQYTYHYKMEYWDLFNVQYFENAPEWDGHTDKDVDRLLSLSVIWDGFDPKDFIKHFSNIAHGNVVMISINRVKQFALFAYDAFWSTETINGQPRTQYKLSDIDRVWHLPEVGE